ncbi:hypothetical protein BKA66DRAFT_426346 [Pyrenochaeta sp. MPI-SDFR-AT-0127]|nr:hypothetical protein BKA66DRAFT_426346 [Pyrenochaeta sp. MPI-SDFR-AT-0127]
MPSQTQIVDITMVEPDLEHPLFDEAIDAIQASVLDEHRQHFHHQANASLLLNELHSVTSNSIKDPKLVLCSRKFAFFVRTFAPYFDVLNICVQVRPEWVGWFWGIVRLVLKTSSDYPSVQEKIADMFEVVAHILPLYKHIYETSRRSTSDSQSHSEDDRLTALMSYVYADLVYFSLDVYHVFCRGSKGFGLRHPTFESTQPALWRPLDSRFSRLEARITQHRRWLEKETEGQVQNFAEVAQHRKNYLSFLQRQSEIDNNRHVNREEQRMAKRMRRVAKAKTWLSSCSSPVVSNTNTRQQVPKACDWFLEVPMYRKWKEDVFDRCTANDTSTLERTWQHRVLFVQARTGFGKTYISDAVIDDLAVKAEELDICDEPPSTAFFHFDRSRPESTHPGDAFRNLACQLLQMFRHDGSTLDAICLLLRRTSCRDMATIDEVLHAISLLLRQHPTFLVIDGVDECSDLESFLMVLAGLCRKSDTRVIVFSRPNIKIPLEYQKWASDAPHILSLTRERNEATIESYVTLELNRMADQGFFGISMDRTLIPQVARASNGEFLWASMLVKFLQSPALSSSERHAILQNIQSLEGLETLYCNMLIVLGRRPLHEKRIIADTFRWLSFSINHLSSSALRAALCTFDSNSAGESYPTDVIDALSELTCGLLHVENNAIVFAHRSIREHLQAPLSQDSEFSLYDESSVHEHLAARCLSYLAHDVPKRPLGGLQPYSPPIQSTNSTGSGASLRTSKSGDSGYKSLSSSDEVNHAANVEDHNHHNNASTTSIRTIPFDTHLPFLRYAALCWPIHLSRALSDSYCQPQNNLLPTSVPYLGALSAFLTSRIAVTTWVEASFRYNLPPTLTRLVGPLSDLKGEISPTTGAGKDLRLVVTELRELSERLVELKRDYTPILRDNASLIWQMESSDEKEYWPVWEFHVNGSR